jgi:hypothetical protein
VDLHNTIKASRAFSPAAAVADNTPYVSEILATANFDSNELLILTGALADADATFTLLMEEGDEADMSDHAAVADDDLIGTEAGASFTFADDNKAFKIGYRGSKAYLRATLTPANNGGNAYVAMVWVQSAARKQPTS